MLMKLFQSLTDRVRALFVADVALDFEAELIRRQAERKHRLLQQADDFHKRGYQTVAADLRQQAERMTAERPLAGILPAINELSREPDPFVLDATPKPPVPQIAAPAPQGKRSKRKAG